jgi:predicted esterase
MKINSAEDFDKTLKEYRSDNNKKRRAQILRVVRQHISNMSQRLRRKKIEGDNSGNASVLEGRDVSDREFAEQKQALLDIEKKENIGLMKVIKQLERQHKIYKEEKTINGARQSNQPGLQFEGDRVSALKESQIKKLVIEWNYGEDEPTRFRAKNQLINSHPQNRKHIFESLASGKFRPRLKQEKMPRRQAITLSYQVNGKVEFGEIIVQLPDNYSGRKKIPLVFRFHEDGGEADQYSKTWDPSESYSQKFIAVTPTLSFTEETSWSSEAFIPFFFTVYQYMLKHYYINSNQVYLSGFAEGAEAAFNLAQRYPHLSAGLFLRSDIKGLQKEKFENCLSLVEQLPMVGVVGVEDSKNRNDRFKAAKKRYGQKSKGISYFKFVEKAGHDYIAKHDRKGYNFLEKYSRKNYPRSFNAYFFVEPETSHQMHYWIKGLRFEKKGSFCQVTVKNNKIIIQSKDLRKADIYLNDEIVNMDKSIIVILNGKTIFYNKVVRSADFLVNWFDEHQDINRLFWNKITVYSYD